MAARLTSKQQRVYDYIRTAIRQTGTPPTRAEIAEALGFASANAAQAHVKTLAQKGMIQLAVRSSRSIRLIEGHHDSSSPHPQASDDIGIPVIGQVAAGAPIHAFEHITRRVPIPPGLFRTEADYLLTVQGDSMTGAGILDGDLLGVRQASEINNGQIGIFRLDDEVTVKRFRRQGGGRLWLQAENPNYQNISIEAERDTLTLEGIAVGVIRTI